jgi:hypothetical protein
MESDAGVAPTFYDGETSSINSDHGKFLTTLPHMPSKAPLAPPLPEEPSLSSRRLAT